MLAELYEWLKAAHILMAIVWVGGAIMLQILAIRAVRSNDRERMHTLPARWSSWAPGSSPRRR